MGCNCITVVASYLKHGFRPLFNCYLRAIWELSGYYLVAIWFLLGCSQALAHGQEPDFDSWMENRGSSVTQVRPGQLGFNQIQFSSFRSLSLSFRPIRPAGIQRCVHVES